MDLDILEGDLKSNLGLEKFSELPITTDEIDSKIDSDDEKSETAINYLNFISNNLFEKGYRKLSGKRRNFILLVSTPVLNAIMKGKIDSDDIEI